MKSIEDLKGFEAATHRPVRFDKEAFASSRVIRVATVDGDSSSRASLAQLITEDARHQLIRTCADANSALMSLPHFSPDIVFIEINLPDMDGLECMRRLRTKLPGARMIIWTASYAENRLFEALIDGAGGYLLKETAGQTVLNAIAEVHRGGLSLSAEMTLLVVQRLLQNSGLPQNRIRLTPREQEVLEQLSKGYRYKEIVRNLGISLGTLHSYISKVYEKLHVHSRTEAVVKYLNL